MTAPGRVGVIADSTLQGHLLSSAVKGQGYQVLVSTEPEALENRWLDTDALDLLVVDLSSEDRWQQFLDDLLERAEVPILFCDGQAPVRTDALYPKWERRLVTKLVSFIGKPAVEERLEVIPARPSQVRIPQPREFHAIRPGDQPRQVWVH